MGTSYSHTAHDILVRCETEDTSLGEPVSAQEVVTRLSKAANSAPSPLDRLTYSHLRRFDPEGKILAALFSACLRIGDTPTAWRQYVTVLIFKRPKEPSSTAESVNPKNWRPIALLPTISKLLSGVLADRLQAWAGVHSAISPAQKGCYPGEGCFEHVHVLKTLRDFASPSKPVHLGFLDLADAFTSVPHDLILDTLRARGIDARFIQMVQSLYSSSSTCVSNSAGEQAQVHIHSGVRQGCPASPILFALAIEPLLRTQFVPGSGAKAGEEEVHVLAYADDLVVVASSPEALQLKLDSLVERATKLGLRFNPSKCASLSWGRPSPPSSFLVDGIPIKAILDSDFYRYLGTPIGISSWQPNATVLSTFRAELDAVSASPLRPWQKLDALRTFSYPRLSYHLRAADFHVQDLEKRRGGLDRWALRAAKRILHLPATACDAYLFTPQHLGGVGLPCTRSELAVMQVAHFFRMATCPDRVVQALTMASLQRAITQRCLVGVPTTAQCAAFLNAELPLVRDGRGSLLTPVLTSLAYLRKRIGLRVEAHGESLHLLFRTSDQGDPLLLGPDQRHLVISLLHDAVGASYFREWRALANQGKAAALYAADPAGLAPFDRWSRMRFCDWRFLHRARLNLIPTNAVKAAFSPEANPCCRVCGYEAETLGHVLGRCWHHSANLNRRHNTVQDAVVSALPDPSEDERDHLEVLVNRCPTIFSSSERIDLQVVDHVNRTAALVDFKCPFESGSEAFATARQRNELKYEALAERYRRLGFDVSLNTICVGALGTWDPQNFRPLKTLGVPDSRVRALRTTICRAVLHISRNIWVEHVTGTPQTY
jgi:hypothetical protein